MKTIREKIPRFIFALLLVPTLAVCADDYKLEIVAQELAFPWSLAFMPNDELLVTGLPGRLRLVDSQGNLSEPIPGLPAVYYAGQGGLFDVVLHPQFSENRWVYLSFAEGQMGDNRTAIARGRWEQSTLVDIQVIFRVKSKKNAPVQQFRT